MLTNFDSPVGAKHPSVNDLRAEPSRTPCRKSTMAEYASSSTSKRAKLSGSDLTVDDLSVSDKSDLTTAFFKLCSTHRANNIMLIPYKVNSCNAAVTSGGVDFAKAFCDLETLEKGFFLGDVFRKGLDIGIDFLTGKTPDARHEKIMLRKLVNFLKVGKFVFY